MDHLYERPPKRVCSEQISASKSRSIPPMHDGNQSQDIRYNIQHFLLSHESQLEQPPSSLPLQPDERPSHLQNEPFETIRASTVNSNAISSQESGDLKDAADLVCFGSVGVLLAIFQMLGFIRTNSSEDSKSLSFQSSKTIPPSELAKK